MKIGFYTFGCKVNQYETQAMEQLVVSAGHSVGAFEEPCDGYVINTCSVTAMADRKNRTVIRRCRSAHPQAVIGVCGCYTQHASREAEELGVDVIGGSSEREQFVANLLQAISDRQKKTAVENIMKRREFEVLPAGALEGRTRAMLKVQDGCCNYCSYCIIPYTRGPVRSAPLELAVEHAQQLAKQGYREIVLTGIEIASWGLDLPGKPPFSQLVEAVCNAVPDLRVRLGSLEPRIITPQLCQKLKCLDNLCHHFHLSMQSGCDSVLKRMNRKYDTARYLQSVELLKETFPDCAVTTDMIVAFPGETQEEMEASLEFIRQCGFADMHIFPYSRRPGTPADGMPGQHTNQVKQQRSRQAIQVAKKMSLEYRENLVGTVQKVLMEEPEGIYYTGHAENYVKVYVEGKDLHNQILPVRIIRVQEDGVFGQPETQ